MLLDFLLGYWMGFADGQQRPIRIGRGLLWATDAFVVALFAAAFLAMGDVWLRVALGVVAVALAGLGWVRLRTLRMMERRPAAT